MMMDPFGEIPSQKPAKTDRFDKIESILNDHLSVLADAAKKECSGEDLKAITEAMKITIDTLVPYL